MRHPYSFLWVVVTFLWSCSTGPSVIPEALEPQVDKTLIFSQLKENPDSYKGRLVVLGGEVLKATRLQDGTQIEVLQLPLENSQRPTAQRMDSKGRFLAVQVEFLDPAKLVTGTPVMTLRSWL